jgi:hypothetical protein
MFCGSCGSAVNDGLSFCPNCGAPVIAEGAQPVPQPGPQPVVQNFQANTVQQPIVLSQAQEVRENGFAIAGFFVSLVAMVFMNLKPINIIMPLTGLVFSIIGVTRKNSKRKGLAIAGIILGSMFLIAGLGITFSN